MTASTRRNCRESLLASTDSETAEQLAAIRGRIVDHVRKAGDIDALRAALPTPFKGFTFDGLIETEPREEAIIGFHFLRDDEGVATESFVRKTSLAMPGNIIRAIPSSIRPQRWCLNAPLYLHRASFKFAKETQIRVANGETLDHLCRDRPASACHNNLGDISRHRRRFLPGLRVLAPTGCSTVRPLVLRLPAAQDERHSSREARMEPSPCQDCDATSRSSSEPPLARAASKKIPAWSPLPRLASSCATMATMETQAPSAQS